MRETPTGIQLLYKLLQFPPDVFSVSDLLYRGSKVFYNIKKLNSYCGYCIELTLNCFVQVLYQLTWNLLQDFCKNPQMILCHGRQGAQLWHRIFWTTHFEMTFFLTDHTQYFWALKCKCPFKNFEKHKSMQVFGTLF